MADVIIYSTPTCPYCARVKQLLKDLGVAYTEKNVTEHADEHEKLAEQYEWRTVPMIFIGGEFIGGYDDLAKLQAGGALQEKLNA